MKVKINCVGNVEKIRNPNRKIVMVPTWLYLSLNIRHLFMSTHTNLAPEQLIDFAIVYRIENHCVFPFSYKKTLFFSAL